MVNYTWKIDKLEVLPIDEEHNLTNVVKTAFYTVEATSGNGTICSASNCATIFYSEGSDYTDFNDLTEQEVVVWVKNFLGEDGISSIEEFLAKEIERKEDPKTIQTPPLPWL